ncbi:flagellar export chaperone FliS [Dissulfurirhabdus thermomarina]|uniref:Flagellar export chaperone FliS n=1 Tax=Dissulfurirhabdus thermomarina TaxID=1765737 RepID=A0A6N9TNE3_DISTH|nr:flagellar export chaperone FliS [Dissulfurirhabdus thermomarina]NDY42568.1 flagellar export chaperone FliS [Dissulfurirhabdus thermomarina]NMX23177.1 flagellar export chaperone FliS [Dissulfurirhabdus thermomarina]
MTPANPYSAYRKVQAISTSDPKKLVLMLYEACLRALRKAEAAIRDGDVAAKGEGLCKAVDIITELSVSLDRNRDDEMVVFLDRLYAHLLTQLSEANLHSDAERVAHVFRWVEQLRDAWKRTVMPEAEAKAAGAARPEPSRRPAPREGYGPGEPGIGADLRRAVLGLG